MKEDRFWEWWYNQPLNSFASVDGAYNYWSEKNNDIARNGVENEERN